MGHETERDPVVAVPRPRRLGPVFEDVALMTTASRAVILRTRQNQLEVPLEPEAPLDRGEKTRPTGAAIVFARRGEQREMTRGAHECPLAILVGQRAGARRLRGVPEQHGDCVIWQEGAPLLKRLVECTDASVTTSPRLPR